MSEFKCISTTQVQAMIDEGPVQLMDIRDPQAWGLSRIPGATHLHNDNLMDFLRDGDPDRAVVVYCYHGHASQSAAALLAERGFDEVYSMDGGFEQWRTQYPVDSETRS